MKEREREMRKGSQQHSPAGAALERPAAHGVLAANGSPGVRLLTQATAAAAAAADGGCSSPRMAGLSPVRTPVSRGMCVCVWVAGPGGWGRGFGGG